MTKNNSNHQNKAGSEIIPAGEDNLALRSQNLVKRGLNLLKSFEEKVLHFPNEYSLGNLFIGDESSIYSVFNHPIKKDNKHINQSVKIVPAQGNVIVNEEDKILLDISPSGGNLEPLMDLSSDSLWAIISGEKNFTNKDIKYISGLSGIRLLSISSREITSTGLKYLSSFKKLKSLHLSLDRIDNSGIASFNRLNELEVLDILLLENTSIDLGLLSSLSKLRKLSFGFARTSKSKPDVSIGDLASLPKLNSLEIFLIDFGISGLENLNNLKSLLIFGNRRLTEREFVSISNLDKLENLHLRSEPPSSISINPISDLPSLTNLHLHDSGLTDSHLNAIANIPKLQSLSIIYTLGFSEFSDEGFSHLRNLHDLKNLTLYNTNTSDEGVKTIGEMAQIETLSLIGERMSFTDNGLEQLSTLKNLTSLNLAHSNISDDGLISIQKIINLESLNLNGTSITDKGIEQINNLPGLKELSLIHTDITNSVISRLKKNNELLSIVH